MSKPIVAIVGRPNVGKSTLFNMIAGERIAIVKDTPGVTRDRIYAEVSWLNHNFTLMDTGGIEPETSNQMLRSMREQAEMAIEMADVVMFVVDVQQGVLDADYKVADMLRKAHKDIVLVVNKVDNYDKMLPDVYEFYNLGIGDPHPISSLNKMGLGDMLDEVTALFPKDLVIVSDVAGTTRDAIDTDICWEGKDYVFIDTAGLRRKNKIKEEIERYSILRTVSAVERADVVVLMIDAEEGITEQDAKIAGIAHDRGRGMIIAVNKWDAIEKDNHSVKKFTNEIRNTLSFMPYAEILFISAKTGQRIPKLFDALETVIQNHSLRIATGVVNEILMEAVAMQQPPSDKGRRLKIYYMTQVSVKPPTFVVFVNDKRLMHFSYTRYLENKIREAFGFAGTPLRFLIRERSKK